MNVCRREVAGEQFLLIEIDHDLHVLPPIRVRQNYPRDRHEQGSDSHVGEVKELRGGHVVGTDFEHGHRYGGWCETHDHGRGNIRRQRLHDSLRNAHDIRFGPTHIHIVFEEDIRDTAAVVRVAMDVLDAFHRGGQEAFEQIGDAPFYLLWQHTGVDPDYGGDGNRDIREDVGHHAEDRPAPEHHDQDRHHHEGVWPAQGNENHLHHGRSLPKTIAVQRFFRNLILNSALCSTH